MAAGLVLEEVDPLAHGAALKSLFAANGRADFASFFDSAYANAVRAGGRSVIARDASGAVVMHVAFFVRRFRIGPREVVGALRVNSMVDARHRSFFPALALFRRLVTAARKAGGVDFMYGAPNAQAAGVVQAAGFRDIGPAGRLVLPISRPNRALRWALRAVTAAQAVRHRSFRLRAEPEAAAQFDLSAWREPRGSSRRLRACRPREIYAERLPGYPGAGDVWYRIRAGSSEVAAALVRPAGRGVATLADLQFEPDRRAGQLLHALVPHLRRGRYSSLQLTTLLDSAFGRELRRAGLFPREANRMYVLPFTPAGEAVTETADDWQILGIDWDG